MLVEFCNHYVGPKKGQICCSFATSAQEADNSENKAAMLQMRGAGGKEQGTPGRERCLWGRQLQTEVRQEPHFVG